MASHRRPDDEVVGDITDWGGARETGSGDDAPRDDHFGLFDDGPPESSSADSDASGDGGSGTTDERHLEDLRAVLAGRVDPEQDAGDRPVDPTPRGRPRRPRRRHPVRSSLVAVVVMAVIAAGVVAVIAYWRSSTAAPTDYAGTGEQSVVIRVQSGDGLYDVGSTLLDAGVVANVSTFVSVAVDDGRLKALPPGFYSVHEHSSSQSVVDELANPDNRLGHLRIIPGQTLGDVTVVSTDGSKTTRPGIYSTIADACVPADGDSACFTVDDLRRQAAQAPLSDLGVVGWAAKAVAAAPDPERRLEGLILPGDYDIAPGSTARQALAKVVSASAAKWNTTDIVDAAAKHSMTPYELATVASLVQAEGIGDDMRKVARVIYNRLDAGMKLQFDSTVNYGLGRAQIATSDAERLDPGNVYSTYAHAGLPPTPIGAPGPKALDAAEDPANGSWLYFVAVDLEGHSCFSTTFDEHQECVAKARANGVFG